MWDSLIDQAPPCLVAVPTQCVWSRWRMGRVVLVVKASWGAWMHKIDLNLSHLADLRTMN